MSFSINLTEHFASFAASDDALDDVREFVQGALLESQLRRNAIAGLLLAVEEAVTNITRHGYLYGPGQIRIRIRRHRRFVEIVLTDNGRPMKVDFEDSPDVQHLAETGRKGGLGLMLIRKVTDRVDYQRRGDQNVLTFVKFLRSDSQSATWRSGIRRKVAWAAGIAVAVYVIGATIWTDWRTRQSITADFFNRWNEFAQTASASAAQAVFNNRSDAELDELIVGLARAHPELAYLHILDSDGRIRADSKSPDRVHDVYSPPPKVSDDTGDHPLARWNNQRVYSFGEPMTVGDIQVGSIVFGVPESLLEYERAESQQKVYLIGLAVLFSGEFLVALLAFVLAWPLRKMNEVLGRMQSQGGRLTSSGVETDEVRAVVSAMNEITDAVARTEQQMARREAERREIEQATQLQQALLPQVMPKPPGFEAAAEYRMARHVGGDYYDLFPIDGDKLWVVFVADVAGKGFPAALMMTAVRTALRILAPSHRSPSEILKALNDYLTRNHPGGPFVTAVCGVLDPEHQQMTIASAGHTPLLHVNGSSKVVQTINPRGRPLGTEIPGNGHRSPSPMWDEKVIHFAPNDLCLLYTDGFSEVLTTEGNELGIDGLVGMVGDSANGNRVQSTVGHFLEQFDQKTDPTQSLDDQTLLALQYCGEQSSTDTTLTESQKTGNAAIPQ